MCCEGTVEIRKRAVLYKLAIFFCGKICKFSVPYQHAIIYTVNHILKRYFQ